MLRQSHRTLTTFRHAPVRSFRHSNVRSYASKPTIIQRLRNPGPPLLARWPYAYYTLHYLIYATGALLAAHAFIEYFYESNFSWGISMLPTINSEGDLLIISKYYHHGRGISVGDIVSFKSPVKLHEHAVKRVVGMPGDFVERDTPGVGEGMMVQVPEGHCWVVGDNLTWSRDSRIFGPLPLALVRGKVIAKMTPNLSKSPLKAEWIDHDLKPAGHDEDDDDVD